MNDDSTVKRWRADLAAWATSLRFSGFTVLVIALVAGGAVIVSPSLSTYIQQQREIAELRASVDEHQGAVDEIDDEREKWKDPVYIRAQARDRLFYVLPGETQLNVIDDILMPAESEDEPNAQLSRIDENWAAGLISSILVAGTTDAEPADLAGDGDVDPDPDAATQPSDPADTSAPTDTPDPEETTP